MPAKTKPDIYHVDIDGKSLATLYHNKDKTKPTYLHIHDVYFNLCAFDNVIELANQLLTLVAIARKPMTEESAHYEIKKHCHEISIETQHHFRCCACHLEWTVLNWQRVEFIFCPHCGTKAKITEIQK